RKQIQESRQKLFSVREKRIHPHKDDKILTSWYGLMIVAFVEAGRVFHNVIYIQTAKQAIAIIKDRIMKDSRSMARFLEGEVKHLGFIDDYANILWANIEMYETCFDVTYLKKAIRLSDEMTDLFWDAKESGFYLYGDDGEALITRPKELYDAAV